MLRRAISGSLNSCYFILLISYQPFSAVAELLYIPTMKVWAGSSSPSTAALGKVCPLPGYSSHLHFPHGWHLFHVLIRHLQVPFDEMFLLAACRYSNWIVCGFPLEVWEYLICVDPNPSWVTSKYSPLLFYFVSYLHSRLPFLTR